MSRSFAHEGVRLKIRSLRFSVRPPAAMAPNADLWSALWESLQDLEATFDINHLTRIWLTSGYFAATTMPTGWLQRRTLRRRMVSGNSTTRPALRTKQNRTRRRRSFVFINGWRKQLLAPHSQHRRGSRSCSRLEGTHRSVGHMTFLWPIGHLPIMEHGSPAFWDRGCSKSRVALMTRYSGCLGSTLSPTSLPLLVFGHRYAGKLLGLTREPDRRARCILGAWFRLHVPFRSRSVLWPTKLASAFRPPRRVPQARPSICKLAVFGCPTPRVDTKSWRSGSPNILSCLR